MTGAVMVDKPTPPPAAEVEAARSALREHLADLTSIIHHKIETDSGDIRHATSPPLLDQIAGEIAGNSANDGGPNWLRSKEPLWMDGAELLREIDRETRGVEGDRTERVRRWGAVCASGEAALVVWASELAARWATSCRALLYPQPKMQLRGQSCPQCGATRVWDRQDKGAGENYARPALAVDAQRGACVCRACGAQWLPELFEHLAQVLRQQQEEHLAAETKPDPAVKARTPDEKWDRRRV